ncbi:Uma2 family endonuclease [Anaerosporobacter sp.]|uniref:Uma2 family endonuclease n=1 Tax=Anaerosporobacter sp. TaxID=1872529 RepID=UPI00286F3BC0|nr:Uma2 family endonuclease [Anaerosporobacter sp.]
MLQPNKAIYTIDDIYALPEGERAELIDGQIYAMSPPNRLHQKLSMELSVEILDYIKKNNGSCEVYSAPFAVFLNEDTKNYVEPDISVICDKNKLDDRGCNGAPDWIIEIVSPNSKRMDYHTKLFKYRTAGVKEYWIVNPERQQVLVYDFVGDGEKTDTYSFADTIKVGIYDNLHITISKLINLE